jgi:CheY-like chemotaxis protein
LARVFLLEDHSWFRKAFADLLGRQPDFEVIAQAGSLADARREAAEKGERIDLALVDLLLPDGIGTELIRDLRADGSEVPVLVLTAPAARPARLGALDGGRRDDLQGRLRGGDPRRHEAFAEGVRGRMVVLVAIEPRSYRQVIGQTIQALRPHVEVVVLDPDTLGRGSPRWSPISSSRTGPTPSRPGRARTWVEFRPYEEPPARVCLAGRRWELEEVELSDLLSIVDRTEELSRTTRDPGNC